MGQLVLRLAGPQGDGQIVPMLEEAMIRHLKHAANVGRLVLVEKKVRGGRVGVLSVVAIEETQSHQRVEEIAGGARMEAETPRQCIEILDRKSTRLNSSHLGSSHA